MSMLGSYSLLIVAVLGGIALLTGALFGLGRRVDWIAKPPAIDVLVILYSVAPWIAGWEVGRRIHGHWSGGIAGFLATYATQFVALELFDFVHTRLARRRRIAVLEINRTLERRFGSFWNRFGLWGTVPSIPFFLLNRLGHYTTWYPLVWALGFTRFNHSDYIAVSRHKIRNLVGADLVWCLYCDWMTGGWALTSEMLNEVESYWCPLAFADKDKCEKCSEFFRMEHWAPLDSTPAEVQRLIGIKGGGRPRRDAVPCASVGKGVSVPPETASREETASSGRN